MIIKEAKGYELEKAQSNTSEDYFNRSEVVFLDENNEERTFHLLYVRYFDEIFPEFTPYEADPLFTVGERDVTFKDIAGLVCLLKNTEYRSRKRVYINTQKELQEHFAGFSFEQLPEIFKGIAQQGQYKFGM